MKTYVKPTVDVVELSVKENMASGLPTALEQPNSFTVGSTTYGDVITTVYDLTATSISGRPSN